MKSIKRRYFFKLIKSIIDAIINASMLLFVPNTLGPINYGNFNFIRDTFQSIIQTSDLNLGTAHNNAAARKVDSQIDTNFYFSFVFTIGIILLLFVSITTFFNFNKYLFPAQETKFIFLGSFLAYLMYFFTNLMGYSDSKTLTIGFEKRSIIINIILFSFFIFLFFYNHLNLTTFFIYRLSLYFILILSALFYFKINNSIDIKIINPFGYEFKNTLFKFLSFSGPLIFLSFFGLFFSFFDRWFLQIIDGSKSQGMYSLAFALSSIAGLFLSPFTPLVMQTVAKADEEKDDNLIISTFSNVKLLYLISVFLSLFFIFHVDQILQLTGGSNYNFGKATIMIMFLHPMHVVYGQIAGGTLIALQKTKLYTNISIYTTILGFFITYFLIAPVNFAIPGFGFNSFGLALKVVIHQFIAVNIQTFFICKYLKISYFNFLKSQFLIPIPIIFIAIFEYYFLNKFYVNTSIIRIIISLIESISIWVILIVILIFINPKLFFINKNMVDSLKNKLLSKFKLIK
jgi:O-antigen/teichoic acid export membrane protein